MTNNLKLKVPKIKRKKKKNVSKHSYIIKKQHTIPQPSQLPFWASIQSLQVRTLQKKRKRTLEYVLTRSRKQHTTLLSLHYLFKSPGRQFQVSSPKSTKEKEKER